MLLNLKQFRGLYPEYDYVSDGALVRKIHDLFYPEYEYSVVGKQLIEGDGKWSISFLLNDLYEKRGDAYLRTGDFRRGVLDFNRIFNGIPNFADTVERWRLLGNGQESYLDVKTVEFTNLDGPARLWLKIVGKDKTYTVDSYD